MKKKIIVVGAGIGGLATAIRLAARGHEVDVYEKRDRPGGRVYGHVVNDFHFDGGPGLISAPYLLDKLWRAAGRNREEAFALLPVEPSLRLLDDNGDRFDYSGDTDQMLAQIERRSPNDRVGYQRFLQYTHDLFDQFYLQRADQPFQSSLELLSILPAFLRLGAGRSIADVAASMVADEFLRKVLSFPALLMGGNPFETPALYHCLHHLLQRHGVWHAPGGTGTVVAAMCALLEELGGRLALNSEVVDILVQNRRVSGVRLRGGNLQRAEIVVANADPAWTYRQLIAPAHRQKYSDRRIDGMRYGMSLFILQVGTRRRFTDSNLRHHNILFSPRYAEMIDSIFNKKFLPANPALYVSMPTLTDPTLAPAGGETLFIAAPVPNLDAAIDWTRQARPYRDAILNILEMNYLPGLRAEIVAEHYYDPLYFQNTLNSYKGAAFSFEPVLHQTGWLRPRNRSEEFENLYFTGAGTHPGAGIPGVLASAEIVDGLITASL